MATGATSTLSVTLVPKLDKDKLAQEIKAALEAAFHMNLGGGTPYGSQSNTNNSNNSSSQNKGTSQTTTNTNETEQKKKDEERNAYLQEIQKSILEGFNLAEGTFKEIFSVIQEISSETTENTQSTTESEEEKKKRDEERNKRIEALQKSIMEEFKNLTETVKTEGEAEGKKGDSERNARLQEIQDKILEGFQQTESAFGEVFTILQDILNEAAQGTESTNESEEEKKKRDEERNKRLEELRKSVLDAFKGMTEAVKAEDKSSGGKKTDTTSTDSAEAKKAKEERNKKLKAIQQGIQFGFQLGEKAIRGVISIVQDIFGRVKQSSAFLQTVEGLFNLAMTLLLMPLGNALADTILPATAELVESVVGLWDQFDEFAAGGDLQGIISTVLNQGLKIVGDYFKGIAGQLTVQGGLLGAIGKLLDWIGNFVAGGRLEKVLTFIFTAAKFIADYFPYFAGIYVANEIMKIGLMITQIVTTAVSSSFGGKLGAGIAVGTLGIAAVAGSKTASMFSHAGGADYPPTPGGHVVRVAEGGEWESITPSSKKGGGNNGPVNITINGYTHEEVIRIVREEIRTQIIDSRYRNGI